MSLLYNGIQEIESLELSYIIPYKVFVRTIPYASGHISIFSTSSSDPLPNRT